MTVAGSDHEATRRRWPLVLAAVAVVVVAGRCVVALHTSVVEQAIGAEPGVASFEYSDEAATLAEFERVFTNNEEAMFSVVLTTTDHAEVAATAERLARVPGVMRATSTVEVFESTQRLLERHGCSP